MTATSLCSSSLRGGPHTFTAALHLCLTSTSPKQFLYVLSHLLCYVPNNNFKSGFTVSPSMINIFFTRGKDPGENSLHPLAFDGLGFLVLIQDQFSSVQSLSCVHLRLRPHGLQHPRFPCPSPTPGACSNSHPLSQ